jgi:hypothetical protein
MEAAQEGLEAAPEIVDWWVARLQAARELAATVAAQQRQRQTTPAPAPRKGGKPLRRPSSAGVPWEECQ